MLKTKKRDNLNVVLILVSIFIGLLLCEGVARVVRHKSDIFPVNPSPDPILGLHLQPFESGHDGRGFRNSTTEGYFPILCIGDSQIYGYGIPLEHAIPQQLSLMLGKNVYSMALPTYGPIQYYHLFKDSRNMHSQKIIISIFLGNDLLDAYFMVSGHEYWKWLLNEIGEDNQLQKLSLCPLNVDLNKINSPYLTPESITLNLKKEGSLIWRVHSFLRLHGALYAILYEVIGKPLVQKHVQLPGFFYSTFIDTVFVPGGNLKYLDLHDPRVRCGLLITKRIIELMSIGQRGKHDLMFTIIPTKESVYYKFLKNKNVTLPPEFICCVHYEKEISRWLINLITSKGFEFVDVFPSLENAANDGALLYHNSSDCHLNSAGSRIVATCLYNTLKNN